MIAINGRVLENSYTSAEWASSNPILPDRVAGYDSTVKKYKLGDGVTHWADLGWWSDLASNGIRYLNLTEADISGNTYGNAFNYDNTTGQLTLDYTSQIQDVIGNILPKISVELWSGNGTDFNQELQAAYPTLVSRSARTISKLTWYLGTDRTEFSLNIATI